MAYLIIYIIYRYGQGEVTPYYICMFTPSKGQDANGAYVPAIAQVPTP